MVCHDPHTSEFAGLTRAATNELCLACHQARTPSTESISLFSGSETISRAEFAAIPKIALNAAGHRGHPYVDHPVTGQPDPLREGEDLSCLSCHRPHGAELPQLLRSEWKEIEVCDRCHSAVQARKTTP